LERVLEGNTKGVLTDKWRDMTTIRPDDIGYAEKNVDITGNPVYKVRVHFRGKLDQDQQSMDLFTMMLLEAKNGVNFQEKNNAETDIETIIDIVKNKKFYRTEGMRVPVLGKYVSRNKRLLIEGEETNTYKRLVSLMESNLYDILHI